LNPRRVACVAAAPITFTPSLLQSGKIGPKLVENNAAKAIPDATSLSMSPDPAVLVAEPANASMYAIWGRFTQDARNT
jgi:hypothetical protein